MADHDMTKGNDYLVPFCLAALAIIALFIFIVLYAP
jgi:hypothetical protein